MQEKTIEKFQSKIAKLEEENLTYKHLSETYKSRYLKEVEKADKYEQMWNTAKLFIKELLKNNPDVI